MMNPRNCFFTVTRTGFRRCLSWPFSANNRAMMTAGILEPVRYFDDPIFSEWNILKTDEIEYYIRNTGICQAICHFFFDFFSKYTFGV